jgi:NAD(P)H dehydrogenase (quinone)
MGAKILIIMGHPDVHSFCGALGRAYQRGAEQAGYEVEYLELATLSFDPVLRQGFRGDQGLEPDLSRVQSQLSAANHWVWVYPNWWGGPPALLKGFIDRVFLPGFAFQYHKGPIPQQLLKGRSAHLLMTLDTPPWFYRYGLRAPGLQVMKKSVLGFSGVRPVRTTLLGAIRGSSAAQRERWLSRAQRLGESCA